MSHRHEGFHKEILTGFAKSLVLNIPADTIRGLMKRWETGAGVCVVLLIPLAILVALRQTDAAEMPWVLWALGQRREGMTALIQVLTFFTSATPALLLSIAAAPFSHLALRFTP